MSEPEPGERQEGAMSRAARCFVLAAVCAVASLPVAPAGAVPPSIEMVPFDEIEVVEPGREVRARLRS